MYHTHIAIPYIDALLNERFSTNAVKFNPSLLPPKESLSTYGIDKITILADFYGKPAKVEFDGEKTNFPSFA